MTRTLCRFPADFPSDSTFDLNVARRQLLETATMCLRALSSDDPVEIGIAVSVLGRGCDCAEEEEL
jgi:hypothetical protein